MSELRIADQRIELGETRDVELPVAADFTGEPIVVPLRVVRAAAPGPTLCVTAAVHGDELNGAGVIRRLIASPPFTLVRGSLVLAPVVNVLGFTRHSRYMPDRRDLNRSFPGQADGSLASRYAHAFFHEVLLRCDACVDLHTAAIRRTNMPNVRADLQDRRVAELAARFDAEITLLGKGPKGALRREACRAGVPTIILEAGEPWKIEPAAVEAGLRGVHNVLAAMGMIDEPALPPAFRFKASRGLWVRADAGGMLTFHAAPGDVVEAGQPLATNTTLLGRRQNVLTSPISGLILGMTTHPSVQPGDPVCHIAKASRGVRSVRQALAQGGEAVERFRRIRDLLARSLCVEPYAA